jgi:hypothetical protein
MPESPVFEPAQLELPGAEELVELRRRMRMPQRHRLLHGYPQAAAMPRRKGLGEFPFRDIEFGPARARGLLVGVLPHPFCNPALAGCGFCTFPHEVFNASKSEKIVDAVIREIAYLTRRLSALMIDRKAYRANFGSDPLDDFPGEFAALKQESLIDISETVIKPTPRGMFYADSIAVLWAWKRVRSSREELLAFKKYQSERPPGHMG